VLVFGVIDTLHLRQHFLLVPELPLWPRFPSPSSPSTSRSTGCTGASTRGGSGRCTGAPRPTELYWLSGISREPAQNALYVLVSLGWALALHIPSAVLWPGRSGRRARQRLHAHEPAPQGAVAREGRITPRAHLLHSTANARRPPQLRAFLSVWDHLFALVGPPRGHRRSSRSELTTRCTRSWQIAGL